MLPEKPNREGKGDFFGDVLPASSSSGRSDFPRDTGNHRAINKQGIPEEGVQDERLGQPSPSQCMDGPLTFPVTLWTYKPTSPLPTPAPQPLGPQQALLSFVNVSL